MHHEESGPLFVMTGVEDQLESIFGTTVQLPSGGYIVINQTEALVAIDVNSGKATRERNVENTALKTNMEAAAEACRQMRLRDLAGLIVIDFIDMEDSKNNRAVEKKMKDSLKIDRARVQTGRISQFGLFEISRQRRRAGVLELSSEVCDHCGGTGRKRSIESAAIQLLRMIEARAADDRVQSVYVSASSEVALYLLNEKRSSIADIEADCHVAVRIEADEDLKAGEFNIEGRADGNVIQPKPMVPIDLRKLKPLPPPAPDEIEEEDDEIIDDGEGDDEDDHEGHDHDHDEDESEDEASSDAEDSDGEDDGRKERGGRGRRGGRRRRGGRDGGREGGVKADVVAIRPTPMPVKPAKTPSPLPRATTASAMRAVDVAEAVAVVAVVNATERPERNRIPDIAADGGEMLDSIASAPFLILAPVAEPEAVIETAAPLAAPPIEATPVFAAPVEEEHGETDHQDAPAPVAAVEQAPEPVRAKVAPPAPEPDHEIAATSPQPAPAEPKPSPAATAAEQAEARRHAIHGAPEDPAPAGDSAPKKAGWWSKRKTG